MINGVIMLVSIIIVVYFLLLKKCVIANRSAAGSPRKEGIANILFYVSWGGVNNVRIDMVVHVQNEVKLPTNIFKKIHHVESY